jgi:hypothetical protein
MKTKQIVKYSVGLVIAILIGLFLLGYFNSKKIIVSMNPENLTGIQKGSTPWLPELKNLGKRLQEIGLPALIQEGTALHTHEHLDIIINGQKIIVPADIGVNDAAGFSAPIHTHDETAIIHVESPIVRTFNLGQFFDIWGVLLTKNCIGGYCNNGNQNLKVFVDGILFQGDPRTVELKNHEEIVITFGIPEELPTVIPSSFNFPAGY